MPDLTIAPLARKDLKGIGRYSQETWGLRQRDAYLGDFAVLFERIRIGAVPGHERMEIKAGLLGHPCNKHVVFFRRDAENNVEILRILHERMDFVRHL
jgi:toxin ParE1/3/4